MDEWDGEDRRHPVGWHLKKEISVGHVLTTATIIVGVLSYAMQNEKNHATHAARLDALQTIVLDLKANDLRQEGKIEATVLRLETKFERMEDKLDRVLGAVRANDK